MRIYRVPDELRSAQYEEDSEVQDGDYGKCGGCNWEATNVYLVAKDEKDLEKRFKENHRGLCGDCMTQMIAEKGWEVLMTS
jgi:hypothetical protein